MVKNECLGYGIYMYALAVVIKNAVQLVVTNYFPGLGQELGLISPLLLLEAGYDFFRRCVIETISTRNRNIEFCGL